MSMKSRNCLHFLELNFILACLEAQNTLLLIVLTVRILAQKLRDSISLCSQRRHVLNGVD